MASAQPVRLAFNVHEPSTGVDEKLNPIIYLHGLTASKEYWIDIPQKIANATGRKGYSIDARNHGDSEWSDDWNFDLNADDIIHFIKIHGIQKAILVGHSMGAITAIKVAFKRPDLIEKVILEDMYVRNVQEDVYKIIDSYISLSQKIIQLVPTDLDEVSAKGYILQQIFQNTPEMMQLASTNKEIDATISVPLRRDASGRYTFKANFKVIGNTIKNPEKVMMENSGCYEGPALFIYGKLSPFSVGDDEQQIKQLFPNAVLLGVEGAAHSVHLDKISEFTDAVIKFISS